MHEMLKRVAPDFIENIRELNKKELNQFIKELNQFIADKEKESELLTNAEIYKMFCEYGIHPVDYRPLDSGFVEGKQGITIFCVNGDILFYFPNKERKKTE